MNTDWCSSRFTRRVMAGPGLDWPFAREIVEAHGGRISLTDASGRGARVAIELPIEEIPA
jgi:signal transduction histidine kinase